VLALARDGELRQTVEDAVEGLIIEPPRGSSGFGYDPVFQPIGATQTFAELTSEEKNLISHRARAIRRLRAALGK
jgi:XTP/dITP diphosphohydrolase